MKGKMLRCNPIYTLILTKVVFTTVLSLFIFSGCNGNDGDLSFSVTVDSSKTSKVCQLIGDLDRQTGHPTGNLTASMYGLYGTDLGSSFVFDNKIWFLFGDSWKGRNATTYVINNGDSFAYTSLEEIKKGKCINLSFESRLTGTGQQKEFSPIHIIGGNVGHDAFEVPTGGFEYNSNMYIFYATNAKRLEAFENGLKMITMTRNVLARRHADGGFEYIYDLSIYDESENAYYPNLKPAFINVSPVLTNSNRVPGLPKKGTGLLLFASGFYRLSKVYLAYIHLDDLEKRKQARNGRYVPKEIYYFAGFDGNGTPIWKSDWENHSKNAAPLFDVNNVNGEPVHDVGELSVVYDENTHLWYMAYNSLRGGQNDRGIHFRYAQEATPWMFSERQIIFKPFNGYGKFMHIANKKDGLNDPGRFGEWGGEYGPYMIQPMFKYNNDSSIEVIYFTLSTWNPYTVVLMKSAIQIIKKG